MTIDHLAKLEAEATRAPWEVERYMFVQQYVHRLGIGNTGDVIVNGLTGLTEADAALIAAARNHLPALIRVARAAKEYRETIVNGSGVLRRLADGATLDAALKELEEVKHG